MKRLTFQCATVGLASLLLLGCNSASLSPVPEGTPATENSDREPPFLIAADPSNHASSVPVEAPLTLLFSEKLDPLGLNANSLQVFKEGFLVSGEIAVQDDSVTFTPTPLWDFEAEYSVVLTSELTDLAGNSLVPVPSFSFTTESFETDLPIVLIDTLGETILDDPKIPAAMKIISDENGGRNGLSDPANAYDNFIGIEIRGTSSQLFPKKQFGFETWDETLGDADFPLLGFPEETDWIWQASYADKTFLRNVIPFTLSNQIERYASRTKFVELFLREGDDQPPGYRYWGLYVLMEKIKRDPNRVNISKLRTTDNQEPEISGGYILAFDIVKADDIYFLTERGTKLVLVEPKAEDITDPQLIWIQDYLNQFEVALYGPNFKDPLQGYNQYIDVDTFVDYLLINEIFMNLDALNASTYMYKDRNQKLCLGPIWDFIPSWGSADPPGVLKVEGWQTLDLIWTERLMEDETFAQKFVSRYQEWRQGPFQLASLFALIDEQAFLIQEAQERNFLRWPILGISIGTGNPIPYPKTYSEEIQRLKDWMEGRLFWMDAHIEDLISAI